MNPVVLELLIDLGLWFCFFLGVCVWILKCAAAAIRSPLSPIKTRLGFVHENWDIFLIRLVLETVVIFYPWRHYSLADLAGWLSISVPSWFPSGEKGSSFMVAFLLGLAADVGLDALAHWKRIPERWRNKLKEEIPHLPQPTTKVTTETVITGKKAETHTEVTTEVKPEASIDE